MTDYAAVLTAIRGDKRWTLEGDDYDGLVWLDESPKPTRKTLDDAWPQIEHDREVARIEQLRRARYQAETDGLFFEAQREGGDLTAWQAAVDQIKADLPYPEAP
jgi:hypothetical protein